MESLPPRNAAGGVIVGTDGKIVLVWQNDNSWSFPKGGIEAGESLLEAAMREITEETGLTELLVKGELGSYTRHSLNRDASGEDMSRPPGTRTFFLFTTTQTVLASQDAEVTQTRWVTIDEALSLLTHPKDAEFLQSVRQKVESVQSN
jgi:8-oxo-dGTP pyrophosphatase MutT (NUDIX family)